MTSHVEDFVWGAFSSLSNFGSHDNVDATEGWSRQLGGGGGGGEDKAETHISFQDLYASIIFFACIYVFGQFAARLLKMPSLVGEIFAGIILGPNLVNFVPYPISFVMLGEIGLILLVIEAGIDIDLTTLKLIGTRGLIIAIIGSILPILIAFGIALAIGTDMKGSIAAGASFGPTSLGIAMNILRQGKIVNTPVGQLIISAAVIDDMIALIILSQLSALSGTADVAAIVIPIVSALAFLIIGGYAAIYILPPILDRYMFSRIKPENHGAVGLALMFLILFGMMPATYYAKSSFLMGAFISGLVFCRNHDVHVRFVTQFKRLLQWLMRIFFAASIGFQVPIKDFGNGIVIGYGLLFTVALLGKLAVGFLVPNFSNTDMFRGLHLRDCLVTGFSMAAEGEFAFVIAVFAVDQKLISPDLYASIVLAVLLSTIIPPFALRFTISYYNNLAQKMLRQAEDMERKRAHSINDAEERTPEEIEADLRAHIKANKIVFLCIQIQCSSTWGLIPKIISTLSKLNVEVIDNRSWHPRGVDTTLMTEIFVQDDYFLTANEEEIKSIDERIAEVSEVMTTAIRQPGAKVKVTRWFPGVLQNIVEEVKSQTQVSNETVGKRGSVRDILAKEATKQLETKRNLQIAATQPKSLDEIKTEMGIPLDSKPEKEPKDTVVTFDNSLQAKAQAGGPPTTTRRRVRQKMRSTPVVGGSLFDETPTSPTKKETDLAEATGPRADPFSDTTAGQMAELVVSGEVFHIRIMPETIHRIRSGYSGELLDDASVRFSQKDVPIEHRLQGLVRTGGLETISEDISDTESNRASDL